MITDKQIKQLREEALAHGDYVQADICDLALAAYEDFDAEGNPLIGPSGKRVTRSECRQICEDAIYMEDN